MQPEASFWKVHQSNGCGNRYFFFLNADVSYVWKFVFLNLIIVHDITKDQGKYCWKGNLVKINKDRTRYNIKQLI